MTKNFFSFFPNLSCKKKIGFFRIIKINKDKREKNGNNNISKINDITLSIAILNIY